MIKIVIIIVLLLALISLASGFFFLIKDGSKSTRLLNVINVPYFLNYTADFTSYLRILERSTCD